MEEKRRVPCEVYSRIVGYFRPTRNWNTGKRQEFADRQVFRFPKEMLEEAAVDAYQKPDQDLSH